MKFKPLLILIGTVLTIAQHSYGQNNNFWTKTSAPATSDKSSSVANEKKHYFKLDLQSLKKAALKAPGEDRTKAATELIISFPTSDGQIERFSVSEAPVLSPELSAKYPGIYSYAGKGLDDPTATIRFSVSSYNGVWGTIFASDKTSFIEPFKIGDLENYKVYEDLDGSYTFECKTSGLGKQAESYSQDHNHQTKATDPNLRTYRTAILAHTSYGDYFCGTGTDEQKRANILAQINSTLTQVNAIFERELSVRLQLIPDNDKILFFGTIPLPQLEYYQEIINDSIGYNNYDIGHTFGKLDDPNDHSGNAGCIACTCSENKGLAITFGGQPFGSFYAVLLAHEMGHQMGAWHTMSSPYCIHGNGQSEVEPASGSTIMSYAGVCWPSVEPENHDYFNQVSIRQINSHNYSQSCGTLTNLGNSAPTANAGPDYTIPKSTPFVLTGQGSDPDGDNISYTWEQNDPQDYNNIDRTYPTSFKTSGPMFRSYPPSTSPVRTLPNLETILNDGPYLFEVLPSVSRELNFVLTVRDNHPGGGRIEFDSMKVIINGNSGPFEFSSSFDPNEWHAGTSQTVTWNVAGTNSWPINCQNVKISLSSDGGQTFPYVLSANTPNDGSENVIVPANISSTRCRLKIEAINNIFFAISKNDFIIIKGGCVATVPEDLNVRRFDTDYTTLAWLRGNNADYEIRYREEGGSWIYQSTTDKPGDKYTWENINNLSPATNYEAQVRSICDGTTTLTVRARGVTGQEHINLRINNNIIGSINLTTTFQNYTFETNLTGGITVQFDNDMGSRDVVVDYVEMDGEIRQAKDQSYNTAAWDGYCGGGSHTEWMHCNGLIGFGETYSGVGTSDWSDTLTFMVFPSNEYHPDDISILLKIDQVNDIYDQLDWMNNPDPGTWEGVTWSDVPLKRVLELNIGDKLLTGNLYAGGLAAMELLDVRNNYLTSLNMTGSTQLTRLVCENNLLTELDLSTQYNLVELYCSFNIIKEINFGTIDQLVNIGSSSNHLTSIDLENMNNLANLNVQDNYLTGIDVNNCSSLLNMYCKNNKLTSLELLDLPNLLNVDASLNNLTSVELSNLPVLWTLILSNNQLTGVTGLNNMTTLTELHLAHNNLANLSISNLTALGHLNVEYNNLSSITGLSEPPNLWALNISNNNFTTIDLTDISILQYFSASYNGLNSIALPSPSYRLEYLDVSYNELTELDLIGQEEFKDFKVIVANDNKLERILISGDRILVTTGAVLFRNKLAFTQLIKMTNAATLTIDPMNEIFDPVTSMTDVTIDYSAEAMIESEATTFSWYKDGIFVTSNTTGIFTTTGDGVYYCEMENGHFPDFTLTSATTTIGNASLCNITVPDPSSLPSLVSSYSHMYVVGSGGPDLSNVVNFNINWSLENNQIWDIAFNTNNGNPDWWVNLMNKVTYTLNTSNPEMTISGSGVSGLDGSYWVTMDGNNFVMASKSGTYAIYCSNSNTQPCTQLKSTELTTFTEDITSNDAFVCIYPNPSSGNFSIEFEEAAQDAVVTLYNSSGKPVYSKTGISETVVHISGLSTGIYFININCNNKVFNKKLVVE